MAMYMYMHAPQGPTLLPLLSILRPQVALDKVRFRSSVRRHRGEEQVHVTGGHRRRKRWRVLNARRLSDDFLGLPSGDVRVDDGGMDGSAGWGY